MTRALLWVLLFTGAACRGRVEHDLDGGACQGADGALTDEAVMTALKPTCEGCHSVGPRGFVASLTAFEGLLVANPRLVAPGRPDDSELVHLLEGKGTGDFQQMPAAGPSYAELVAMGKATLTTESIRAWIAALPVPTKDTRPDPDAPRITRMSALQIQRALYQQLGLDASDFFAPGSNFGVPMVVSLTDDYYPLESPDAVPAPFEAAPADRFMGLGGGAIAKQSRSQLAVAPTFVLILTQVSQRWCRLALAKPGNTQLFNGGVPTSVDPQTARQILGRWHRHFWAEIPTDDQVNALYDGLFAPLAASDGVEPALVASCSYFIRHPHWIIY
jgi:hypothetical protein